MTVSVKSSTSLQGTIEGYDGGFIKGWALDSSSPHDPIELEVYDHWGLAGTGTADRYRPDVREAGIGSDYNGFQVKIRPPTTRDLVQYSIVESTTHTVIATKNVDFREHREGRIHFSSNDFGVLAGTIEAHSAEDEEEIVLNIIADYGDKVGEVVAERSHENTYEFQFQVPSTLCDGRVHAITLSACGNNKGETTYIDVFPSLLTPWEHLVESSQSIGYASLSRTSAYRYESLRKWLTHLSSGTVSGSAELLSNLQRVHEIAVEGPVGRTDYEPFFLPHYDAPDASIVIPAYNSFAHTYHCLASIALAWTDHTYEVIVVDDCSSDETADLESIVGNAKVIRNARNRGFVLSCNSAIASAAGDYVVILNNDTEVTPGWLDELLAPFSRFEAVGLSGSKLLYPDGTLQDAGGIVWGNGQPWNLGRGANPYDPEWSYTRQVDYVSGAALAIPRALFENLSGFSQEFAPGYYEDTDLAFKVRAAGYKTVLAAQSVVLHAEGVTSGQDTDSGMKRFQEINAPKFRRKWSDAFVGTTTPDPGQIRFLKDRGIAYRTLVIDQSFPKPNQDAGSYAAIQEIKLLQASGHKVTFFPENLAHLGKYTEALQRSGIECLYAPFFTSAEQVLQQRGDEFDLVYVTRYEVAERIMDAVRQFSDAKILFNNADLHFLRELREASQKRGGSLEGPVRTRERELEVVRKADGILTYNRSEQAVILSHTLRGDNLYTCPWVLEVRGRAREFSEREGLAFLGGFRHPPNHEGIQWFVYNVMPALRKRLPGVTLNIYGSGVHEGVRELEQRDVIIRGFVESLDDVFQTCRVFVCPLLSGAGIKGKLLEAIANGTPTVVSPIAAEGTGLTHGLSTMIADNVEEWVESIAALYESEQQWTSVSDDALRVASANYNFDFALRRFGDALSGMGLYPPNAPTSLVANTVYP